MNRLNLPITLSAFAAGVTLAAITLGIYSVTPGPNGVVFRMNRLTGAVQSCYAFDTCESIPMADRQTSDSAPRATYTLDSRPTETH